MVDIHSHALPFVDDGAKSMSDALAMIERAIACGVTDLFLTPHYRPYQDFLATPQRIRALFAKVVSQVQNRNLNIRLHLGNEIFYSIEVIDLLRKDKVLKMGNSDMVLIEFATGDDHETIIEAVHNLVSLKLRPIIAHVERYEKLRNHEYYSGLKRMGALIQVNAGAVLGHYGKPLQKRVCLLIKHKLVDFIASDAHDEFGSCLKDARLFVEKKFGFQTAESLLNNKSILI
ncbi:MAG: CpsB/CapC family capsule biosynthesis tyrosine phosphatase [Candidatus Izemoplasmatales bacterium]|jgi:protein-tyrosine phosphatase